MQMQSPSRFRKLYGVSGKTRPILFIYGLNAFDCAALTEFFWHINLLQLIKNWVRIWIDLVFAECTDLVTMCYMYAFDNKYLPVLNV